MRDAIIGIGLFALAAGSFGCATTRAPEQHLADTRVLLEGKRVSVKQCYDEALKADAKLAGTVTLRFTVEKETGRITNTKVDAGATAAPEALTECVKKSVDGLALTPADRDDGDATFVWELKSGG